MKSESGPSFESGSLRILLYVPNILGYARFCLLLAAYFCWQKPVPFLVLYCCSISLDLFDGWSARKLNQCSAFGAWLDVIVDNVSRTCIWTNVTSLGWIIVSVEWITFVCNHQAGSKWREENFKNHADFRPPWWVLRIMENGFKTGLGTIVILGLHCLPVWIYAMQNGLTELYFPTFLNVIVCLVLTFGRILCLGCELWCIKKHIIELLLEDDHIECNKAQSTKYNVTD